MELCSIFLRSPFEQSQKTAALCHLVQFCARSSILFFLTSSGFYIKSFFLKNNKNHYLKPYFKNTNTGQYILHDMLAVANIELLLITLNVFSLQKKSTDIHTNMLLLCNIAAGEKILLNSFVNKNIKLLFQC